MSEPRARPSDLCMADAMPFQQHHEYRTTRPIAEALGPRHFLDLRGNLRAGDAITICRFRDASWRVLTALAEVRVVEVTAEAVRLHLCGQIAEIAPAGAPPALPVPAPARAERFAGPDWRARHLHFGKWAVLDAAGREVCRDLDRETAHAVARGDRAVPELRCQRSEVRDQVGGGG